MINMKTEHKSHYDYSTLLYENTYVGFGYDSEISYFSTQNIWITFKIFENDSYSQKDKFVIAYTVRGKYYFDVNEQKVMLIYYTKFTKISSYWDSTHQYVMV